MMNGFVGKRILALVALALASLTPLSAQAQTPPPSFSKAFSPGTIGAGSVSTLTFTIDNNASGSAVDSLSFTDNLPAGMSIADGSAASTCIGAAFTAPSGGTTVAMTDGSVGASDTCTLTVNVTSSTPGAHPNTTGDLTSDAGNSGPASDTLTVSDTQVSFSKSFADASIPRGATTRLTFAIDNPSVGSLANQLNFTDALPSGLSIATPANAQNFCGGTLIAPAGGDTITFFNGFVVAGSSCSVEVDITGDVAGSYVNQTTDLTRSGTPVGKATAPLTVTGSADLPMTKEFTDDPVARGQIATLEFNIRNTDRDFSATGLAFTDDLTTFVPVLSTGGVFNNLLLNTCGGTVSGEGSTLIDLSGGTIAPSGSCTLRVEVLVPSGANPGSYTNTSSSVTATVNGTGVTGAPAAANLNVVGALPLTLTKAFAPASIAAGDPTAVRITITNPNDSGGASLFDASGIALTDILSNFLPTPIPFGTLPSNPCGPGSTLSLAFVGVDEGFALSNGTLAEGGSCTFDVPINTPASLPADTYTNTTSELTAVIGDETIATPAQSADLEVSISPAGPVYLDLTKAFTDDPVAVDATTSGTATLQFTLLNRTESADTATSISFTDDLGTMLSGATFTGLPLADICGPGNGSAAGSAGDTVLSFTGATLAPTESCTFSVTVNVPAGTSPGDYDNTTSGLSATAGGAAIGGGPGSDTLSVIGVGQAPLTITKAFLNNPVLPGGIANMRISLTNPNGSNTATNGYVADDLNAMLAGASAGTATTADCGASPSITGTNLLIADGLDIAPGATCVIDVPVTVPGGASSGSYINVTSAPLATIGGNLVISPAGAVAALEVVADPITFSKQFTGDPVVAGNTATLSFSLQNISGTDATGVSFSDDLDAMLSGALFNLVSGENCGGAISGFGTGTFDSGSFTLNAGSSCSIAIEVAVPGSASTGDYPNTTSDLAATLGSFTLPPGVTASDTLSVNNQATDIAVTKTDGVTSIDAGDTLTYTIVVANNGPAADPSVNLSDTFPTALTCSYTSSAAGGASGNTAAGSGDLLDRLSLPVGGSVTYTASCLVDIAASGTLVNTATATGSLSDAAPGNESATDGDTVIQPATPLGFAKAFSPATIDQGDVSTLTFTIDNSANAFDATGMAFTDDLPTGVAVASLPNVVDNCSGSFTPAAGETTLTYSGGTALSRNSCTVSVDVRAVTPGAQLNTAGTLTSNNPNSSPGASATLTVTAVAPAFSKLFTPDALDQGEETVLSFTVDNSANNIGATGLAFTDNFPSGLIVAATPAASNGCGGTFTANPGDASVALSGGSVAALGSCTLDVTVRAIGAANQVNTTTDLTSSLADAAPASATLTINPAGAPGFAKAFSPATVDQGAESTLSFTIDNSANSIEADALAFTDNFPAGLIVANVPGETNTCGGTFTAIAGGSSVALSGGNVPAAGTCTLTVQVRAIGAANQSNTTTVLTSTLPQSTAATATLNVNAAGAPGFTKAFAPDTVDQGQETVLSFTIDNSANSIEADALAFTDNFPAGLIVADTPAVSNGCGGTFTANPGEASVVLAGGNVAELASCTIDVSVRAIGAANQVNTTEDLTSTLPTAAGASATLTVNAAAAPGFTKAFTPDTVDQGQETVLSFTIDNSANSIEADALAFTDNFPAGLIVASTPAVTNGCGGTFTANPGEASVELAGGNVAELASCTIDVSVRAIGAANQVNTTEDLTSTLPTAAGASATLTVNAAAAPGFTKAFTPDTVDQGLTSVLTFTIDNSANSIEADALAFTDNFPAGLIVASTPAVTNGCGGAFTAVPGEASVELAGGNVAELASCTIDVSVQALANGALDNVSDVLTSTLPQSTEATATLNATPVPLTMSMSFAPATIEQFQTATLTIAMRNSAVIAASAINVIDTLPAGVMIATPANASTTCGGGTLAAPDGGDTITYSGGTLAAGGGCLITVDVTSAIVGSYPNATETQTSNLGDSIAPSATLTVDPVANATVSFVVNTDTDGVYGFTSTVAALSLLIESAGGTAASGPLTVPAGAHTVAVAAPTEVAITALACDDTDSTGDPETGEFTLNLAPAEAVTCTVSAQHSLQPTIDTINRFLTKRADLILSSEPNPNRRFDRLNNGSGNASPLTFSNGDLKALLPFTAEVNRASGSYKISTSLLQARQASASLKLAHGSTKNVAYVENNRFDAWFEAQYKEFDAGAEGEGHFAIAYVGADYLLSPNVLLGALVQFDDMSDASTTYNSTASGFGWMAGPYLTARLASNLYFDARLAAGTATNKVSPFNTYTDTFQSNRWLAMASLSGDFQQGPWTIRPNASLSYFTETQDSYVDSVGTTIPSQTVELGQFQIGPTFTGQFVGPNGETYAPYLNIDAIYNIGSTSGVTVTTPVTFATEGWRGRVKAGVNMTLESGMSVGFGGTFDGIGRDDFSAWGLIFELNMPLDIPKAR